MPPKRKPLEGIPPNLQSQSMKKVKTTAQPVFSLSAVEFRNKDTYPISQSNSTTGKGPSGIATTSVTSTIGFTLDHSLQFISEAARSDPNSEVRPLSTNKKAIFKQIPTACINRGGKAGLVERQGRKKQRILATELPQIPNFEPFKIQFEYHQAQVSFIT